MTMTPIRSGADTAVRAIEANLWAYHETLARLPRARSHRGRDVSWLSTGLAAPNRVWDARLHPVDVERCIADVLARFRAWRTGFLWLTTPSTRPLDLGAHLEEHGIVAQAPWSGMALDLGAPVAAPPSPKALAIQEVRTAAELAQWAELLGRGFDAPPEIALAWREVLPRLKVSCDVPWRMDVGLLDGRPVATCGTHEQDGVVGIYWVATLPEARGRGVATAMTVAALERARARGARLAVLQSTPEAKGVYQRLGFAEHCTIGVYRWNP